MSNWGQGVINNIGWGSIYDKSNAGETLLSGGGVFNNAFIIEVKTDNTGTSNDNQFQFTGAEGDYDVIAKLSNLSQIPKVFKDFNKLFCKFCCDSLGNVSPSEVAKSKTAW